MKLTPTIDKMVSTNAHGMRAMDVVILANQLPFAAKTAPLERR